VILFSCYLSFSRGPWIAAMLAGIGMFLFAGRAIRRQSIIVIVLITIAMVLRPGVWETITASAHDTTNVDSFKGQTYQYRWELWGVAWNKISRSGDRLLFGFGQGATEVMTFDTELSYTGETTKLWSWDNHYAATMMEDGLIGLLSFAGLYLLFFWKLFRVRNALVEEDETMHAAILAAMAAMLFMMTNVAMFAPQLNYLLWSLIAAGFRLGKVDLQEKQYGVAHAR
jgi:O-antigen ligase